MIIPSINVDSFEEVKEKIKLVEPYVDWAHLDISDGTATKYITWHNASDLNFLETPLNIEVHLMISNVDRRINDWLISKVKRIFFHLSASNDPDFVIEQCRKNNIEPGIAISPDESWTKAAHFKGKVNIFQILGVSPGPAGQKATEETFEKIKELRKFCKQCIIEVDGGMNKETIRKAKEAGANIIVAASAIFSGDIEKNIEKLKHAFNR
jgi:ribulose-phosphate 3-epimerase